MYKSSDPFLKTTLGPIYKMASPTVIVVNLMNVMTVRELTGFESQQLHTAIDDPTFRWFDTSPAVMDPFCYLISCYEGMNMDRYLVASVIRAYRRWVQEATPTLLHKYLLQAVEAGATTLLELILESTDFSQVDDPPCLNFVETTKALDVLMKYKDRIRTEFPDGSQYVPAVALSLSLKGSLKILMDAGLNVFTRNYYGSTILTEAVKAYLNNPVSVIRAWLYDVYQLCRQNRIELLDDLGGLLGPGSVDEQKVHDAIVHEHKIRAPVPMRRRLF